MATVSPANPPVFDVASDAAIATARAALDAHTVEMMAWHFHESTGCPFSHSSQMAANTSRCAVR